MAVRCYGEGRLTRVPVEEVSIMRFHPDLHWRHLAERLHRPPPAHSVAHSRPADDEADIAKATVYVSTVALVLLLIVLAAIAFGQEAMHWLGVK